MFQGAFQKDDTKGYPNLALNEVIQMLNMSDRASKLPQHYKKKFMENPNLECLYLVIQVGTTD